MTSSKRQIGIIALVPDEWKSTWQLRHQILTRLAAYFPVVWVNPPHDRQEMLSRLRRREAAVSGAAAFPGFTVYTGEWWLPKLYRPDRVARLLLRLRLTRAQRLLTAQGCNRFVLYLWRPEFSPAVEVVSWDLVCYHIDDDYSFSEVELPMDGREVRLIERVDQVFIHSPALLGRKGHLNPQTTFVPNGVDYAAYSHPVPEPADLAPIPRPRIGYTGVIKRMLDWTLLLRLSQKHSDWSFVFVGPRNPSHPEIQDAVQELASRRNVYFLGSKSVHELPAYPQHFDVCIMPYRKDTHYTKYIYPLKLHEYLASGRPAVGALLPSLAEFADVVALPRDPDEWSTAIEEGLSPQANTEERRVARQSVARRHDWQLLTGKIAQTISHRLGEELPGAPWDQERIGLRSGPAA